MECVVNEVLKILRSNSIPLSQNASQYLNKYQNSILPAGTKSVNEKYRIVDICYVGNNNIPEEEYERIQSYYAEKNMPVETIEEYTFKLQYVWEKEYNKENPAENLKNSNILALVLQCMIEGKQAYIYKSFFMDKEGKLYEFSNPELQNRKFKIKRELFELNLQVVNLSRWLINPQEITTDFDYKRVIEDDIKIGFKFLVGNVSVAKTRIRRLIREFQAFCVNQAENIEDLVEEGAENFGAYFCEAYNDYTSIDNAEWVFVRNDADTHYVSFKCGADIRYIISYFIRDVMEHAEQGTQDDFFMLSKISIHRNDSELQLDSFNLVEQGFEHTNVIARYGGGQTEYRDITLLCPGFPGRGKVLLDMEAKFLMPLNGRFGDKVQQLTFEGVIGYREANTERHRKVKMFSGDVYDFSTGKRQTGKFYLMNNDGIWPEVVPWRVFDCTYENGVCSDGKIVYSDVKKTCSNYLLDEGIVIQQAEMTEKMKDSDMLSFYDIQQVVMEKECKTPIEIENQKVDMKYNYNTDTYTFFIAEEYEYDVRYEPVEASADFSDFPDKQLQDRGVLRYASDKYGMVELDFVRKILSIEVENFYYEYNSRDLKDVEFATEEFDALFDQFDSIEKKDLNDKLSEIKKIYIDDKMLEVFLHKWKQFVEDLPLEKKRELERLTAVIKDPLWNTVKEKLYPKGKVADKNIVTQVYYKYKQYKKDGKPCQFAIVGDPGIGKTTLAEGLADLFKNGEKETYSGGRNSLIMVTPDELEIGIQGEATYPIAKVMAKAEAEKKVVCIDEAYTLISSNDRANQAGMEAVSVLLKLMNGEKLSLDAGGETATRPPVHVEFEEPPMIWMSGYEQEMREMVSRNEGLYRRLTFLSLATPAIKDLYFYFKSEMEKAYPTLCQAVDDLEYEIKEYFRWGTGKDHVRFFANYAGVNDLLNAIRVQVEEKESPLTLKNKIRSIIKNSKREIRRQYRASIVAENKKQGIETGANFETQHDIEDDFSKVRGNIHAKEAIAEIKDMLINADDYMEMGISVPKGALMMGQPGTGKTLLARALAGEIQKEVSVGKNLELSVGFIAVGATDFSTPKDISMLFSEADNYDICIIFIDEIDAIGKQRNRMDAHPELLIQLMKEMDGFDISGGRFVLAATNNPEILDDALVRPGRFDRMIEVTLPTAKERIDVLEYYLGKLKLSGINGKEEIKTIAEKIARITPGESPAYLKNLINEAAILYCKLNRLFERYKTADIEEKSDLESMIQNVALHRVVAGDEKDFIFRYTTEQNMENFYRDVREVIEIQHIGHSHPEKDRKFEIKDNHGTTATAIHEVGHALVAYWNGKKTIDFITTIPRGRAKGYVRNSVDYRMETKQDYIVRIKQVLAGRAAEEVFYGKENVSTGASQDIKNATSVARAMFGEYGFSDEIGMMAVYENRSRYINGDLDYTCSDNMRYKLDEEISDMIKKMYEEVVRDIEEHKAEVEYMAKLVFERESMSGEDFFEEYNKFLEEK